MIKRVIKKIKSIFSQEKRGYPYVYKIKEYNLSFKINNSIEEFRVKRWGGEKEYVISMMDEMNNDDILFDIGSSIGLISVIASKVLKRGKVVSFEPDPENVMRLTENYNLNKSSNYIIQPFAIGDSTSKMKLYTSGSNGYSPSLQKVNKIERYIYVEVKSIDSLLKANSLPSPTIVKIDIEGAEMMALKGMKELLGSEKRPNLIFLELHPDFLPEFNTSTDKIFEYLSQFRYSTVEKVNRDKQILLKLRRND